MTNSSDVGQIVAATGDCRSDFKNCGTTLPAWVPGTTKDGKSIPGTAEAPAWFGIYSPPAVGETIKIKINKIGLAKVTGYFTEGGYLGVLNKPIEPPDWYIKQNGLNAVGGAFGPEIYQFEAGA